MRLRQFLLPVAGLAAAALLAGCSAHGKPSAIETKLANAAKDVLIPLQAESARDPVPATDANLAQGRQVFLQHCALCHSSDGHSQNQLGLAMYPPAMDLTSPHVQSWKDQELHWIIQNGVRFTGMPSWQGILSDQDMWKLTRYIHALPQLTPQRLAALDALVAPPPLAAPAAAPASATLTQQIALGQRLIHQEGCLLCHRFNSEGEDVGPDLSREGLRGRTTAWLAGHFKDPGAYTKGSIMPAFQHLTAEQMNALVALLENAKGAAPPSGNAKK
ncbi:MAG: c-type cytochrome [Terriglobales bacterium]